MLHIVVSNNMEKYRKLRNLSQAKLCDQTGVTQKTICLIEKGIRDCKLDTLETLCAGLNIQVYELFLSEEVFDVIHLFLNDILKKGMMEILSRFYLIENDVLNEEIAEKPYRTYGIAIEGQSVPCFKDVSVDPIFVKSLVKLFNDLGLDSDHLEDVLKDCL